MSNFLLKDPNCVHIHIPKTGGSTIRLGLWGGKPNYVGPKFGVMPAEWDSYPKFAFVRHPLDRFASAFRDFKQLRGFPGDINEFTRIALNESIDHVRVSSGHSPENIRHHTVPQTDPSLFLDRADYVGRFESYDEDLERILTAIGASHRHVPVETRPRLRNTVKKGWREEIPAGLWAPLCDFYATDFLSLGYVSPLA